MENNKLAVLALEDGSIFQGLAVGSVDQSEYTCGEVVFNTAMTGYQEVISDPSYCEQIIMFTAPHIGNVGVNQTDSESNNIKKIWSKGIILKSLSLTASNWRSEDSLNNYLIRHNLIGIANIDTRALAITLREKGALRGCIYIVKNNAKLDEIKNKAVLLAKNHQSLENLDLAKVVSVSKAYKYSQHIESKVESKIKSTNKYNIVVYDFGVKKQILELLANRHCEITVVPATTDITEVLALKPDGVLLSNGPGDPAACDYAIKNTQELIKLNIPLFGICLGFQILALALGAKTIKMKFGHHGANHPVKDLETHKVFITSQNHGFMVEESSLNNNIIITHRSLFDNTIQGLKHLTLPIIGFQGHPEASPGPREIECLFDKFISNIMTQKNLITYAETY